LKTILCLTQKDVKDAYYYKENPPSPDRYPCILIEHSEDGGLGGSYYYYDFVYPPTENTESWLNGFREGIKYV
jgi:hypothetical protein